MALTNQQLRTVFREAMSRWSASRERTIIGKPDLRDGIIGLDANIDANIATLNSWFPEPARTELSNRHKLDILLRLLEARR